ncbi:MAG: hypothetical protein ABFD69_13665 [Candidatus Sumerlaeia bacterium]
MQIEKLNHPAWGEAWRMRRGDLELILAAGDHPRVVSLSRGDGENVLFDDVNDAYGRGAWRLMGGHRLWVAPETEASYETESGPCRVTVEPHRVGVSRGPGPSLIRRRIEIAESDRCEGFRVRHELTNEGGFPSTAAPWAITCVKSTGRVLIPWGAGDASWRMQTVRYWRQWGPLSTDPSDGQWHPQKDRFVVEPRGRWGKVGLASDGACIAHATENETFFKYFDFAPGAAYPDDGCNIAVCVAPDYVEIETLGPLAQITGGAKAVHDEHWDLTGPMGEEEIWEKIQK